MDLDLAGGGHQNIFSVLTQTFPQGRVADLLEEGVDTVAEVGARLRIVLLLRARQQKLRPAARLQAAQRHLYFSFLTGPHQ